MQFETLPVYPNDCSRCRLSNLGACLPQGATWAVSSEKKGPQKRSLPAASAHTLCVFLEATPAPVLSTMPPPESESWARPRAKWTRLTDPRAEAPLACKFEFSVGVDTQHIRMRMYIHIHTYIYISIYIYTHTYMYIRLYIHGCSPCVLPANPTAGEELSIIPLEFLF